MRHSSTVRILIAVAIVAFVTVVVASSLGQSSSGTHVMQDGQTMDGSSMSR